LKEYRDVKTLSQGDLAIILKVTQATVSRLEAEKQNISKATIDRIKTMLGEKGFPQIREFFSASAKQIDASAKEQKDLKPKKIERFGNLGLGFSYMSYNVQSNNRGGDFVKISELRRNGAHAFLIGDSIGHGQGAAYMAFGFELAFEAVVSLLNPNAINASIIERTLSIAVNASADKWKGEPSLLVGILNVRDGRLEFINRGMPHPLSKSKKGTKYHNEKRYKAIDLVDDGIQGKETSFIDINKGDSIIFYSDGLSDLITDEKLESSFQKFSKLFQGDAKAIGKNFGTLIDNQNKNNTSYDDISFLVITRNIDE
jgi:serine phosphatase RsbU (regulator of sigma subunit)